MTSSIKVTGLTAQGLVLFLNGSPVVALPLNEAIALFIEWLSAFGSVLLVVHNSFLKNIDENKNPKLCQHHFLNS